jgi:hypothetical protein
MSVAGEFVKGHKGGGRFYLTAKLLKSHPGVKGTITAKPYTEMSTFGGGEEKEVFRLPIELDSPIDVLGQDRTDALFNPGVNAVQYLIDTASPDESTWIGRKGHFERRELEGSSFIPWFFVLDTAPTSKASPSKSKPTKTASFKCGMCPQTFSTITELQTHIPTHT